MSRSGTTSTVARALGRRSIGIEYSKVNAASGSGVRGWERITKVGMIPREDAGKPQSTAIFKSRSGSSKGKREQSAVSG